MNKASPLIVFSIHAERALFTRHDLRIERFTYPVPTFGAISGVLRSIYAKPAFYWVPQRVLILNPIRYQSIMVNEVKDPIITLKPFVASEKRMQKMQTYLYNVHYIIEAFFNWSGKTPEDENLGKHLDVFYRSLKIGGRRDVFLGLRECTAIVEPINGKYSELKPQEKFDAIVEEQRKEWKQIGQTGLTMDIGLMFHSWDWGTGENGTDTPIFFHAVVQNGVLDYPHPDDKTVIKQQFERRCNDDR
ncbi:MAG: type I-C CRISPR-associated protein Cas5 [Planctomycetes bacterium GWF2_41_51]|nr:MAG: type I-C CRISPR-associated protein Cas5 [Planctomycetes bacterium GWF2_41_51]